MNGYTIFKGDLILTTSDKFREELNRVIDYFRLEYDLTYAEAIGVIEVVKNILIEELLEEDEE